MKYGAIDFDLTVNSYWNTSWNGKALLNIGDYSQYKSIEQLYTTAGILTDNIIKISIDQLKSYRGEKMIVAINMALDSYVGYNAILDNLSPDIIPIFLGMSLTDTNITDEQIACLQKYSPIGCRDERSYLLLKSQNVPCYLNGCLASTLCLTSVDDVSYKDKIVFIDVPYNVRRYIPDSIREQIVFFEQELYCTRDELSGTPSGWAEEILKVYSSKPRMIVSSRFHAAVVSIANDIPVIITLEKYTFRFSWLQNYISLYTEENFNCIDWNIPQKTDYSDFRDILINIAKSRLDDPNALTYEMQMLTDMNLAKSGIDESKVSSQVLYYDRVWSQIKATWNKDEEYHYGFWGINTNTDRLYDLICETFPNAKLVGIYDMFKEVSYFGLSSQHPRELGQHKDDRKFYVIVTAYLASRVSNDIFKLCGFPPEKAFLCEKEFIRENDLL